ncbi:MAG: MaoC family dehydratase N-terminal domain-containing protein [Chloroflexi bacterium]|nr:MaoC family dehydratase N-terminal domain-containing protein [Chloroflexota bacterium]
MPDKSVITDEMRAHLNVESEPITYDVEKGAVIKFAQAIGDPNPLFQDEKAARQGPYGGLIAPPTFLRSLIPGEAKKEFPRPFPNNLDGGSEYEFFEPIRVGDRITVTRAIVDLTEREGRLGTMLFTTAETRYVNQLGQLAATQRTTGISYATPEGEK